MRSMDCVEAGDWLHGVPRRLIRLVARSEPVIRAMDEHVSECMLGDNAATSNASACFSVQLVQMTWAFQGSANSIISCGCY